MAKFQFKVKSSSAKLNYKPVKVPKGLNQKELLMYNRFYNSVEGDLRAVGKKSK